MAAGFKIAEAYAEIRTDTTKFVSGLARARQSLQRFGGGMARVARQAARWGAVVGAAVAAGIALTARAYAKQERAENDLATALRASGQEVTANMAKFKALASVIQQLTTYGDEEILSIQAYAVHLGVTADQLGATTKAALGLSKALQMDMQTALRYTALATQGEFTMLQRYIPELRATEDATEKLAIVMRKGAAGFEAAKADTKTLGGAYGQMKNAISDTAEKIGEVFAPMLKDLAVGLKEHAKLVQGIVKELAAWAKEMVTTEESVSGGFAAIGKSLLWLADGTYVMRYGFLEAQVAVADFSAFALQSLAPVERIVRTIARALMGVPGFILKPDLLVAPEDFGAMAEGYAKAAKEFRDQRQKLLVSKPPSERVEQILTNVRRALARAKDDAADIAAELDKPLVLKGAAAGKEREAAEAAAAKRRKEWAEGIVGTLMSEEAAREANIERTKEQMEAERRRYAGQFVGAKDMWRRIQSAAMQVALPKPPDIPRTREQEIARLMMKQILLEEQERDILKDVLREMKAGGVALAVVGE